MIVKKIRVHEGRVVCDRKAIRVGRISNPTHSFYVTPGPLTAEQVANFLSWPGSSSEIYIHGSDKTGRLSYVLQRAEDGAWSGDCLPFELP